MTVKKSVLMCALVGLVAACGPRSDNEKHLRDPEVTFERASDSHCARLIAAARTCDLLADEGEPPCGEPQDSVSRCYNDCLIEASCADLATWFCTSGSVVADLEDSLPCFTACNAKAFSCDHGSAATVAAGDAGLGDEDAGMDDPQADAGSSDGGTANAASEDAGLADAGAPDSGVAEVVIPPEYVCDSVENCPDGRDEQDCASLANADACDDGTPVARQHLCDGIVDCPDGSDEDLDDCGDALFDCRGDYSIPMALRCDGIIQCPSEFDEVGCPPLAVWQCGGN